MTIVALSVMWILRTGSPWRDLPSEYGGWSNTHRRFTRWRDNGTWEKLLGVFIDEPDLEWLFIDATHCKAYQAASGARGGTEGIGLTKGGETPKCIWPGMRMVCRCNRLQKRDYDKHLYKLRHLVENAFAKIKQWRGLATRYAKRTASFHAAIHVRCLSLWLNIL